MRSADQSFAAPSTYARDLVDAARDNPLPTALIGMGIAWMFLGGSTDAVFRKARGVGQRTSAGFSTGGRTMSDGVSSIVATASKAASAGLDAATDHASNIGSMEKDHLAKPSSSAVSAGSGLISTLSDNAESASHVAGDVASGATTAVSKMRSQAGERASDLIIELRDGFADLLERQPLIVGALGIAAGAGFAAVLPRIAAEEALDETVAGLRQSVRDGFVGAYYRAKDEASAQGLTPEAASDALTTIGGKVSTIAKSAAADAKSSS